MSTFNPIFYYNMITSVSDPYFANQIAYYPFDSNSVDLINGLNGADTSISYANAGVVGNCASFAGSPSLITMADNDLFTFSGAFSMNFWIKFNNSNRNVFLISKMSSDATLGEFRLNFATSGLIQITLYSGGTSTNQIEARTAVNTTTGAGLTTFTTWAMVTITGNGTTNPSGLKIYVNAVNRTSSSSTVGTFTGVTNTTQTLKIGKGTTATATLEGGIDKLRFWKGRELTSTEIANIYSTLY